MTTAHHLFLQFPRGILECVVVFQNAVDSFYSSWNFGLETVEATEPFVPRLERQVMLDLRFHMSHSVLYINCSVCLKAAFNFGFYSNSFIFCMY